MGLYVFQIAAVSEQASESEEESSDLESYTPSWKSFDIRAVVSATEDLLQFIVSEKGLRVRISILRDIIKAADAFLEDEVLGCMLNETSGARESSKSEVCTCSF